ncbi:MAG: MFS transporter [Pseudonocardiaceae bacterium]
MSAVVMTAIAALLPAFTVGALAVPIQRDLGIGSTRFGVALACFFAVSALASVLTRAIVSRLSVPLMLAGICGLSAVTLSIAAGAHSAGLLTMLMVLAGFGNALVQPAAGRYIAAEVPPDRLSLATGLVGAALGAAPLVPGLLVALVAGVHGWRVALTVGSILALVAMLAAPLARIRSREVKPPPGRVSAAVVGPGTEQGQRVRSMVLRSWTLAALLGSVGVNMAATYFVQIGTHSGLSIVVAGALLAAASAVAVLMRIVVGVLGDRAPERNPVMVAVLMLSGAIGLGVLALSTPTSFVFGAVLAVAGGWGWTGLLLAASMRLLPDNPPRAGAAMQIGLFGGAALSPLGFGALVAAIGVPATVGLAAFASLAGVAAVLAGEVILRRSSPVESVPMRRG